jgi:tetratricopeptide (TPR) repeat protein
MGRTGDDSHANTIGGHASLHGPAVQARDIHGGVHFHTTARPTGSAPVPRQLLPVPAHFVNREGDLAAMERIRAGHAAGAGVDGSPLLLVVSGPAGVGKTAAVGRWLRRMKSGHPDGELYADLRGHAPGGPAGPAGPQEVLGHFLRALGTTAVPVDPAEQAALWRSVTADLQIAVMLDNAFSAAQVRQLLPAGPGCLVVVTSRRRLTGLSLDGARFHQLGLLEPAASVELLTWGIGSLRAANEAGAARRVAELCAGLPLAVCLASARLASRPRQPVAAMADAMARGSERLTALSVEGGAAVQSALDESYVVLDAEAARLYRMLGLLPVPVFGSRVAAEICAVPLEEAERSLDVLVEASLIEDIGADAFRFHDLVQLHARARATAEEPEQARDEAVRRVCDWYLATATEAEKQLTPMQFVLPRTYTRPPLLTPSFAGDIEAVGWLDAQRLNLMAVLRTAADRGWHATAWQLADAMWPLFLKLRYYDLWIEAHEAGLAAARRNGHKAAERQMLNSGAIGLGGAGRLDDAIAWYTESLAAAREAGDVRDEGQALLGIGASHRDAGRLSEAVPHLDAAVAVWEGCGYPRGAALARIVLGEIALAAGTPDRAVELFAHARSAFLAVPDPHDATRALAFLGHARVRAGESGQGMAQLAEALRTFEASGAAHWRARTLEMLGDSARTLADTAAAQDFYERALAVRPPLSPSDAQRLRDRLAALPPPPAPAMEQNG